MVKFIAVSMLFVCPLAGYAQLAPSPVDWRAVIAAAALSVTIATAVFGLLGKWFTARIDNAVLRLQTQTEKEITSRITGALGGIRDELRGTADHLKHETEALSQDIAERLRSDLFELHAVGMQDRLRRLEASVQERGAEIDRLQERLGQVEVGVAKLLGG